MAIKSLLELDYYKKTMQQFAWKKFPNEHVKYAFKNRTKNVTLGHLKDQLTQEIDRIKKIELSDIEILFLKIQTIFSDDYLQFLKRVKLPDVNIDVDKNNELIIETEGLWSEAIDWETIILSTVNELYYKTDKDSEKNAWKIGEERLLNKIQLLKQHPDLRFVDFGTRRAYSTEWHKRVVEILLNEIPTQLYGTSNVYLANLFGVKNIGTSAHECPMILSRLFGNTDDNIRDSQNKFYDMWYEMYGENLSICLPDTFGSDYTFSTFGKERFEKWKGFRQDSGDPTESALKQLKKYEDFNIDATNKLFMPSDGLTVEKMIDLHTKFKSKILVLPAIGTSLTNDVGASPISIVMKAVEVNHMGLVKMSDNTGKFTGKTEDIERFKKIFNYENTSSQEIIF
nr:nicotinate phosphoribosyltransferase [uncultured archaeon]